MIKQVYLEHKRLFFIALLAFVLVFNATISIISNNLEWSVIDDSVTNKVPMWSFFIIPYNLFAPFVIITMILVWNKNSMLEKFIISIIFTILISDAIYIIYPTKMIRPEVHGNNIFTDFISMVYKLDPPFNSFPSLHVSLTLLSLMVLFSYKRIIGCVFLIPAITIIISTLFVKQHYFADVIGGFAIAPIMFYLIFMRKNHSLTNLATKKPSVLLS